MEIVNEKTESLKSKRTFNGKIKRKREDSTNMLHVFLLYIYQNSKQEFVKSKDLFKSKKGDGYSLTDDYNIRKISKSYLVEFGFMRYGEKTVKGVEIIDRTYIKWIKNKPSEDDLIEFVMFLNKKNKETREAREAKENILNAVSVDEILDIIDCSVNVSPVDYPSTSVTTDELMKNSKPEIIKPVYKELENDIKSELLSMKNSLYKEIEENINDLSDYYKLIEELKNKNISIQKKITEIEFNEELKYYFSFGADEYSKKYGKVFDKSILKTLDDSLILYLVRL